MMEKPHGLELLPKLDVKAAVFALFAALAGAVLFYMLSRVNYLLYHTLVELAGVVVSFTIFVVGWNTRKYTRNNMFIILACGYLVVGMLDLIHTLAFKGMGVFPGYGADLPTQMWIAARYLETAMILLVAYFLGSGRQPRAEYLLTGFLAAGAALTVLIFTGIFPSCFIEGAGLTTFKIISEYVIVIFLLSAAFVIWKKRRFLPPRITRLFLAAIGFTVLSELSFTLYIDVYGFFNYLGHLFKVFSILMIYQALVDESLKNPIQVFFRDLAEANDQLSQNRQQMIAYTAELEELSGRLDEEVDRVRVVHERTLPAEMPRIEGFDLAGFYQPAEKLGGDFYDLIRVGDKLVFFLSDVSGHGLEGAFLSSFIKEAIGNYLDLKPDLLEPDLILGHLHRRYCSEHYPDDYMICIYLGILDLQSLNFTYSSAGFQAIPLLCLDQGESYRLPVSGLPISMSIPPEQVRFQNRRVALVPGASLLFCTDGLIEQMSGGENYLLRLEEVFLKQCLLPARAVLDIIREDFIDFNRGSMQGDDDITCLVITLLPEETSKKLHLELENRLDELERLRRVVCEFAADSDIAYRAAAGVHELAINAIAHGNKFDPDKKVIIDITAGPWYLKATVEDQGEGFNWQRQLARNLMDKNHEEKTIGLSLVYGLCSLFFYNERGNKATLIVKEESEHGS